VVLEILEVQLVQLLLENLVVLESQGLPAGPVYLENPVVLENLKVPVDLEFPVDLENLEILVVLGHQDVLDNPVAQRY
jgi:hypothetical protein